MIIIIGGFLVAPARRFAALIPFNKNNRGNRPETGHQKAEWLERIAEPPKHEEIAERHGDRGDNNDKERTVHSKSHVTFHAGCPTIPGAPISRLAGRKTPFRRMAFPASSPHLHKNPIA